MKKLRAFTLIELMIAMAIIALLSTAGIQAYTGYVKKGRDTARAEIAGDLNTAVMSYAASNGGNPPGSAAAFDEFLESASEVFGSSVNVSSGNLIEDPVGGREVCLDADGNANQPCSFNYTAYADGTYAISYGVEHESSTEKNFYMTTNSVVAADETTQEADPNAQTPVAKYGVYVGSAPYIGEDAVVNNGGANDGIDETYTPPGTITPGVNVVFRSIRVDAPSTVEEEDAPVGPGFLPDPCDTTPVPGTVCGDSTVYVTSTMRTTPSGGGLFVWHAECSNADSWAQCVDTGATSLTDGEGNTAILSTLTGAYSAADYCADLEFGSPEYDWYLPAKDELNTLYTHRILIGGFSSSYWWSSTGINNGGAWAQNFGTGNQIDAFRSNSFGVRCVRTL